MVLRNVHRLQKVQASLGESLAEKVKSGELEKLADDKDLPVNQNPFGWSTSPAPAPEQKSNQNSSSDGIRTIDVPSLNDDVNTMQSFKYDPLLERQARKWIEVRFFMIIFVLLFCKFVSFNSYST